MKRDLLVRAYNLISSKPDEQIYMNIWVKEYGNTCGTTACAAGHMAADPFFQVQGLSLESRSDGVLEPVFRKRTWFGLDCSYRGFKALAKLLGISYRQSTFLFSGILIRNGSDKQTFLARMEAFAQKHKFSLETNNKSPKEITEQTIAKATAHAKRIGTNTTTIAW